MAVSVTNEEFGSGSQIAIIHTGSYSFANRHSFDGGSLHRNDVIVTLMVYGPIFGQWCTMCCAP